MPHLEIEFKTLLSQAEFSQLLPEFSHVQAIKQTNHYIDTPAKHIKGNRCSLRLRRLTDRAELTLKVPHEVGNLEYNQDLSLEKAAQFLETCQLPDGPVKTELLSRAVPVKDLRIWGELTTIRREFEGDIGLLALDENSYNGRVDYELEVEVTDAVRGEEAFQRYLRAREVKFKFAQSKVARCAQTL